jgi:polyphosphate kinase
MGGEVVRLEVPNEMPQDVVEMLMTGLSVEEEDLYVIDGPLGLDDLLSLTSLPLPKLKSQSHGGQTPAVLARSQQHLLGRGSDQAG